MRALAFAINGTNAASFDGRFFPNDIPHGSGLIDLAPFAGQEIELFFGLRGGTAQGGSVAVRDLRFHEALPALEIGPSENGQVKLTWFIGTGADRIERSHSLNPIQWETLSAAINVTNLQNEAFVPANGQSQFFRLIK